MNCRHGIDTTADYCAVSELNNQLRECHYEIANLRKRLDKFYFEHKIGYCGKHGCQHFENEESICPECRAEAAEAKLSRYEQAVKVDEVVHKCCYLPDCVIPEGVIKLSDKALLPFIGQRVTVLVMRKEDKE